MNVIIVDDEAPVRNTIISILNKRFDDITVRDAVATIEDGYNAIIKHNPELLFLDIELPDGNGFELLKRFPSINFRIIFITGHQEYALEAIKVSALDYILKPIDNDELVAAINKARGIINHEEEQLKFQALNANLRSRKVLKRIILRTFDSLQLISVSNIIRAEADSNYTHFHLADGKHIIVSKTIKEYDAMLSGSGMIRVHQSHLVNLSFIDKFFRKDGGYIQMKDGTNIPVSPNLKERVLKAITDHLYE